jgi:hypothetical protein
LIFFAREARGKNMTRIVACAAGACCVATVAVVALGVYLAQPICPVRYESFYRHFHDAALNAGVRESDAAATAAFGANAAVLVANHVNDQDGTVRQVYQKCVATSAFGFLQRWEQAGFSVEEACVASIMEAADKARVSH